MRLVYQDIKYLCQKQWPPMISPYKPEKIVVNGKSGGASGSSYDLHIASDLKLGVNPAEIIAKHIKKHFYLLSFLFNYRKLREELVANPPMRALANTIEDFNIPDDVTGEIKDKSTNARLFVSAFTTFFDAGFKQSNGTLELVNHNDKPFFAKAGEPICQMIFTKCTQPTERPYSKSGGKYTGQQGPTPAILEKDTLAEAS
jgi:deoxycytidine triphosphate deaminase